MKQCWQRSPRRLGLLALLLLLLLLYKSARPSLNRLREAESLLPKERGPHLAPNTPVFGINYEAAGPEATHVHDLAGDDWTLRNGNSSLVTRATVPGGVFTDLERAGLLKDGPVYFRFNDFRYKWVSRENWIYERTFQLPGRLRKYQRLVLNLDGLDTVADVLVNEHHVGSTDNMFVRYRFDITEHLVWEDTSKNGGKNTVTIVFESPVLYSKKLAEIHKRNHYIVPMECTPESFHGECHVNFIRKMPASFGWDIGPSFPSVGIWRPIFIHGYNLATIQYVKFTTLKEDSTKEWWAVAELLLEMSMPLQLDSNLQVIVTLSDKDGTTLAEQMVDVLQTKAETTPPMEVEDKHDHLQSVRVKLRVPQTRVSEWWPNEFGPATLYDLRARLVLTRTEGNDHEEVLSSKHICVGFRTVELVQHQVNTTDEDQGNVFFFRVNGHPLFVKGANLVPIHILPERVTKHTVDELLGFAVHTHMNMIRVWGGGFIESDYFYRRADELGIMVWQDFMFACNMYPARKAFLQSVTKEIRHIVRNLQHHSSLVMLAGNNENELALSGNWYNTSHDHRPKPEWKNNYADTLRYMADYMSLYVHTVQRVVRAEAPNLPWLVSSPSNGAFDARNGYITNDPGDTRYGDVHYYNREDNQWNASIYPVARMATEYGFQSFPSVPTLAKYTNDSRDLYFESRFMLHRQHGSEYSQDKMLLMATKHFDMERAVHERNEEGLRVLLYLAQVNQAESLRTETEHYRRWRNRLNEDGEGLTMGAVYWQLNSIWPGSSLSTFEFGGKWKIVNYFVEKFFRPVIVSVDEPEPDRMEVFLVNDKLAPVTDLKLRIYVQKYSNLEPCAVDEHPIKSIEPGSATLFKSLSVEKLLDQCHFKGWVAKSLGSSDNIATLSDEMVPPTPAPDVPPTDIRRRASFLRFVLVKDVDQLGAGAGTILSETHCLLSEPKHALHLTDPGLQIQVQKLGLRHFQIELNTSRVALFVFLDCSSRLRGQFSDNGFILHKAATAVTFMSRDDYSVEEVQREVTVMSYFNEEEKEDLLPVIEDV